ncbi:MAG: hypothetical protein GY894_07650 [Planctomycetes bacterium]|jgi:hypothetical protein|nr:hypothetical protein [Planctomycetota bacterium]MCP4839220.1 hypothetical protein [Planctomycetota bacterium]
MQRPILILTTLLLASGLIQGCHHTDFDPSLANAAYPIELHTTDTIPVEVFRDGTAISIVNATAYGWENPTIWINQRFSTTVPRLLAGQTLSIDLSVFRDNIGESFPAGGFLATRRPMPVTLVEVQPAADEPLVGFVAVRRETD